jgi:hypothetical protein
MTTCCDKPLLTPFCPFCGKANRDPLLELVHFLRGKAELHGKAASKDEKNAANEREAYRDAFRKSARTNRAKQQQYADWADLVVGLHTKGDA